MNLDQIEQEAEAGLRAGVVQNRIKFAVMMTAVALYVYVSLKIIFAVPDWVAHLMGVN